MQRYEREIEEILRRLERNAFPGTGDARSESSPSDKARALWPHYAPRERRSARLAAETLPSAICVLLASALVLSPYMAVVSVGLVVFAFVLSLVFLTRSHRARRYEEDLAANDLRWADVVVKARSARHAGQGSQRFPGSGDTKL